MLSDQKQACRRNQAGKLDCGRVSVALQVLDVTLGTIFSRRRVGSPGAFTGPGGFHGTRYAMQPGEGPLQHGGCDKP